MKRSKKHIWCKHFIWVIDTDWSEPFLKGFIQNDGTESWASDDFRFCPYCGKEKP